MFTPEELAEMAAADAEIDTEFRLTQEDLERSRELDREAKFWAVSYTHLTLPTILLV